MLSGIQDREIPLACALTKCDAFDDDEVAEAVDYVYKTFAIDKEFIFPVSALKSLESGNERGLDRLRDYLQAEIAPARAVARKVALRGQAVDLAAEAGQALRVVQDSLHDAERQTADYKAAMDSTASVVTDDICTEITAPLMGKLVDEFIGRVALHIGGPADFKVPSEDDIVKALRQSMESAQGEAFWKSLIEQVESRIQADWSDGIRLQIAALLEQLREARREADSVAARMAEQIAAMQLNEKERQNRALRSGLEFLGILVATTLMTGNVVIGIGIAAPAGYDWWTAHKPSPGASEYEVVDGLRRYATGWAHEVVLLTVDKHLRPKLHELNLIVASQAADAYSASHETWPMSYAELLALIGECSAEFDVIQGLRRNSVSALPPPG